MIEPNESEADLHHLLSALGTANPDPHFDERVLRKVAARQLSRASRRRKVWTFGYAAAAATLLLACSSLVFLHHGAKSKGGPVTAAAVPEATLAPPVAPPTPRRHPAVALTVALQRRPAPVQALPKSYPAPEAPLTEQERLLLKLAHRGDPVELAMLTPAALAAEEARANAEFQEFFKPPPPPAQPVDPAAPPESDSRVRARPEPAAIPEASSTQISKDGAHQ